MDYRRDDGTLVEVEHRIEQHGHPGNGWDDAGEPTIVTITEALDMRGQEVELTAAERERIEQEIGAAIDAEGPPDEPDDYE